MLLEIVMIILGFILLIVGANLLIKGSVNIAKRFHIPEILIGLTIVALGTSLPELIVTITSATKEAGDLIIGNAAGSNLCNLLLILGIMAIIKPIKIEKEARNIHIPILLFVTTIILLIGVSGTIDRTKGIVFFILFIIYFSYPIIKQRKNVGASIARLNYKRSTLISLIYILIGIILLKYGGDFVVDNSIKIAKILNISEEIIGLTIIAFGTSLPELVTSIIAIAKKDQDLAIGNLIGSCIFNILLILGVGAIISPLTFSVQFMNNIIILVVTNVMIWLFCFMGEKNIITRKKGIILITIFLVYVGRLIV